MLVALAALTVGCKSQFDVPSAGASATPSPTQQEVDFAGAEGFKLHGTIVLAGDKRSPAVLLLPGSGPTDRDGNSPALGVKTDLLKQLADGLAKVGISSLRFD